VFFWNSKKHHKFFLNFKQNSQQLTRSTPTLFLFLSRFLCLLLATPGREALFLNSLKIAKRKISNNALCWLAKKKMFSQKKRNTYTYSLFLWISFESRTFFAVGLSVSKKNSNCDSSFDCHILGKYFKDIWQRFKKVWAGKNAWKTYRYGWAPKVITYQAIRQCWL